MRRRHSPEERMQEPPSPSDQNDTRTAQTFEKREVSLPGVRGWISSAADNRVAAQRGTHFLCTPFRLDPPNLSGRHREKLYRELSYASLTPDAFAACINAVVFECVSTHAIVHRVGGERLRHPPRVYPFPQNQCTYYVLYYGTTLSSFTELMDMWPTCEVCQEEYAYHVADACPGYLGEQFLSVCDASLRELTRLLKFSNSLQEWVSKHADSIFRMSLERLNGQQKINQYAGDHARGGFTPHVGSGEGGGASTLGAGPINPVSGEPGDNSNR